MKRKLKDYQGGYSLIGLWPWTGVYAGTTLILSIYIGLAGAVIGISTIFGLLAYLIEKNFPELNALHEEPKTIDLLAPEIKKESYSSL